jgi:hypothetical protein
MTGSAFEAALAATNEIELTATSLVSGTLSSRPVWFILRGPKLYLLSVTGSDTQWYKNVVKTPGIRLGPGDARSSATATPVTDSAIVAQVVVLDFRAKYGARDISEWYPKTDVAVEVSLR